MGVAFEVGPFAHFGWIREVGVCARASGAAQSSAVNGTTIRRIQGSLGATAQALNKVRNSTFFAVGFAGSNGYGE